MSEIEKVSAGSLEGLSLEEALSLVSGEAREVSPKAPPIPARITDSQKVALARILDLYGKVAPSEDRLLTDEELATITEERVVVDEILGFLTKRKNESIRETLANHLDHLTSLTASAEETPTDSRGHFAVKAECPVPGTGKKIQRTVSGGRNSLSIEGVERALAEGKIDEDTYIAITRQPPRALSEDMLAEEIRKNPGLLFTLAEYAEQTKMVTTIKVVKDA